MPTFGEKAVGMSFNPGGHELVNEIKRDFAALIDRFDTYRQSISDPDIKRMMSIAITEAQSAQMWAVKAVTWEVE